jgi:fibronectin type 3 domain-containing protein
LTVTPRDTFAPSIPQNLAATVTGANGTSVAHVDLSWAISSETDLLRYNVYRSDTANSTGARANSVLLMTPVFRDESVAAGKQYFYRVTAIDRAGNESAPSAPIVVTVPISNGPEQP